jgi:hypothetical protein
MRFSALGGTARLKYCCAASLWRLDMELLDAWSQGEPLSPPIRLKFGNALGRDQRR